MAKPQSVWLMRHGEAEWQAPSDRERHLTPLGRQQAESVGQQIQAYLQGPTHVWVSPYQRAQQTCELLIKAAAIDVVHRETSDLITPDKAPEVAVELIEASEFQQLVLVCHMPIVAHLQKLLSGQPCQSFRTAQMAQLTRMPNESLWQLQNTWFAQS